MKIKTKSLTKAVIAASVGFGSCPTWSVELEEIIVTAQKREQSIQDVPFSVSALAGEALESMGVVDITDLQSISPSLITPSSGQAGEGASFRLRGFGSPPFQLGIEPAVATFVDGVYRARSGVAVNDLVDVDRIEVLKGPQGTLFGKNTTAGVIHIITKKPDVEEFEGFVEASYEKYDRTRLKGMVNIPLVQGSSALRLTGAWGEGDGYLTNNGSPDDSQDLNRSNFGAKLLLNPTDKIDITLSANYGQIDEICCSPVVLAEIENLTANDGSELKNDSTDQTYSAEINIQLSDDVTLTSITSYQDYEVDTVTDGDFVAFPFLDIVTNIQVEGFTQELRLAGKQDNLDWTVGAFYSDDEINRDRSFVWGPAIVFTPFPLLPGLGVQDILSQEGESYSIFAQGTYQLSDELSLTAGLRYNNEEKDGRGRFLQPQPGPLGVVNPSFSVSVDEEEPTGMLSVQYQWTDDVMTYLTYQHGYKAGGINLAREASGLLGQPTDALFDAETADNYEAGIKADLMDNRVRLNAAVFYTEYDDVQNQVFIPPTFLVRNGEGSEIFGVEVESTIAVSDDLTLNLGLTVLDTEFSSGTDLGFGDIGGRELPWAPETAASIGWNYATSLAENGLEFFWTGNVLYKSEYFASSGSEAGTEQDAHELLNTQMGLRTDEWSVAIWCRNCTDEQVKEVQFNNPLGLTTALAHINRPIEIGITARYNF